MGAPSYGGMNEPQQESNALDAIRQQTSKIEDLLDSAAEPVKPCVCSPSCVEDRTRSSSSSSSSSGSRVLTDSHVDTCPRSAAS